MKYREKFNIDRNMIIYKMKFVKLDTLTTNRIILYITQLKNIIILYENSVSRINIKIIIKLFQLKNINWIIRVHRFFTVTYLCDVNMNCIF